jgi:hypothetical protein
MDAELHQLMLEHEEFLEKALDNMEYGALLTDDEVACIRQACGKPNKRKNKVLTEVFNDFGNIFGKPLASFPKIWGTK